MCLHTKGLSILLKYALEKLLEGVLLFKCCELHGVCVCVCVCVCACVCACVCVYVIDGRVCFKSLRTVVVGGCEFILVTSL